MSYTYKKSSTEAKYGNKEASVIRKEDGACIPFDPENKDYKEYLKWVADGNTADPA